MRWLTTIKVFRIVGVLQNLISTMTRMLLKRVLICYGERRNPPMGKNRAQLSWTKDIQGTVGEAEISKLSQTRLNKVNFKKMFMNLNITSGPS